MTIPEPSLFHSMQEKLVPAVVSAIGLALVSPVTKTIKDRLLVDKLRAQYKLLKESNSDAREIRAAARSTSSFDSTSLNAAVQARKEDILSKIASLEEERSLRAAAAEAGSIGLWRRILLFLPPRTTTEWLLIVLYYWTALSALWVAADSFFEFVVRYHDTWDSNTSDLKAKVISILLIAIFIFGNSVVALYCQKRMVLSRGYIKPRQCPDILPTGVLRVCLWLSLLPIFDDIVETYFGWRYFQYLPQEGKVLYGVFVIQLVTLAWVVVKLLQPGLAEMYHSSFAPMLARRGRKSI